MYPFRRLVIPLSVLMSILIAGLLYFIYGEGWGLIDSLYMIVITLSTVGFKEVRPLSDIGRLITTGIIVVGVSTVLYTAGQVIEIIFEGQIIGYRRRRDMENKIKDMKNHYIICGFGRVGHQVAKEFKVKKIPYMIIPIS